MPCAALCLVLCVQVDEMGLEQQHQCMDNPGVCVWHICADKGGDSQRSCGEYCTHSMAYYDDLSNVEHWHHVTCLLEACLTGQHTPALVSYRPPAQQCCSRSCAGAAGSAGYLQCSMIWQSSDATSSTCHSQHRLSHPARRVMHGASMQCGTVRRSAAMQVSRDTVEPAVSGTLTLYSAWYPGPGFTGTYDWDGALDMDPNPFRLWGFTGISTTAVPQPDQANTHRRRLRLLTSDTGSGPSNKPSTAHTVGAQGKARLILGSTDRENTDGSGSARGWEYAKSLLAADTLPVQGRVSVRESQLEDPTASDNPSTSGSSGIGGLTPGSTTDIDDEISAFVPASPAEGAREATPSAAPTFAWPTLHIALPTKTALIFKPIAAALGAVVGWYSFRGLPVLSPQTARKESSAGQRASSCAAAANTGHLLGACQAT